MVAVRIWRVRLGELFTADRGCLLLSSESDQADDLRWAVRSVFNAVLSGADRDADIYWTAATYLLAFAIVRDKPAETECWITHPDPRVAYAFRCGWVALEDLRRGAAYPWPLVLTRLRQFHQGRLTAALPKETANVFRTELKRLVKAAGPSSFDALLLSALH